MSLKRELKHHKRHFTFLAMSGKPLRYYFDELVCAPPTRIDSTVTAVGASTILSVPPPLTVAPGAEADHEE